MTLLEAFRKLGPLTDLPEVNKVREEAAEVLSAEAYRLARTIGGEVEQDDAQTVLRRRTHLSGKAKPTDPTTVEGVRAYLIGAMRNARLDRLKGRRPSPKSRAFRDQALEMLDLESTRLLREAERGAIEVDVDSVRQALADSRPRRLGEPASEAEVEKFLIEALRRAVEDRRGGNLPDSSPDGPPWLAIEREMRETKAWVWDHLVPKAEAACLGAGAARSFRESVEELRDVRDGRRGFDEILDNETAGGDPEKARDRLHNRYRLGRKRLIKALAACESQGCIAQDRVRWARCELDSLRLVQNL